MEQAVRRSGTLSFENREQLLRSSYIFRDMHPDLLHRLAGLAHVRPLTKGALLFQQGDDGDALFGVIEGLIRIAVTGRQGKELVLGLMEPGDVFGEIALLDGLPRTASAVAAEDSLLLVIERSHFLALLEQEGRLARHIIELLCERLRRNTERLSENAFLNLRGRLAKQLQALAIAHGRDSPEGVRIGVRLSQTDLAQMLGVTREAVNKQLKTWSRDGLIRMDRGHITVCDAARLAAAGADEED